MDKKSSFESRLELKFNFTNCSSSCNNCIEELNSIMGLIKVCKDEVSKYTNNMYILLGCIFGFLILGIIAIFIYCHKKKFKTPSQYFGEIYTKRETKKNIINKKEENNQFNIDNIKKALDIKENESIIPNNKFLNNNEEQFSQFKKKIINDPNVSNTEIQNDILDKLKLLESQSKSRRKETNTPKDELIDPNLVKNKINCVEFTTNNFNYQNFKLFDYRSSMYRPRNENGDFNDDIHKNDLAVDALLRKMYKDFHSYELSLKHNVLMKHKKMEELRQEFVLELEKLKLNNHLKANNKFKGISNLQDKSNNTSKEIKVINKKGNLVLNNKNPYDNRLTHNICVSDDNLSNLELKIKHNYNSLSEKTTIENNKTNDLYNKYKNKEQNSINLSNEDKSKMMKYNIISDYSGSIINNFGHSFQNSNFVKEDNENSYRTIESNMSVTSYTKLNNNTVKIENKNNAIKNITNKINFNEKNKEDKISPKGVKSINIQDILKIKIKDRHSKIIKNSTSNRSKDFNEKKTKSEEKIISNSNKVETFYIDHKNLANNNNYYKNSTSVLILNQNNNSIFNTLKATENNFPTNRILDHMLIESNTDRYKSKNIGGKQNQGDLLHFNNNKKNSIFHPIRDVKEKIMLNNIRNSTYLNDLDNSSRNVTNNNQIKYVDNKNDAIISIL